MSKHRDEEIFHFVPSARFVGDQKWGYDFATEDGQKVEVKYSRLRSNGAFRWNKISGHKRRKADWLVLIAENQLWAAVLLGDPDPGLQRREWH